MHWIHHYQLIFFDFDGLLVSSEELHFLAYQRMCANRGFVLDWDFIQYCKAAHYDGKLLKTLIYQEFPELQAMEPDWDVLHDEKIREVMCLFEDSINLMPGVDKLLKRVEEARIRCCVVSHSPDKLISVARNKHPILNSIPFWVTREQYSNPKPEPDCYLTAMEKYAESGDYIIGFEDTPRGIAALMRTHIRPVLISAVHYPEIPSLKEKGIRHFSNFDAIPSDFPFDQNEMWRTAVA